MLAKRLPTIFPPLEFEESLEITKIHSVAGLTGKSGFVKERPFKNPHHTVSQAGLIGGGSIPRPGVVSLAHHGVLFLDELPEFDRNTLEVLRQPLEDKEVTISRAALSLTFPASFTLVASMNPCPCGYYGSKRDCNCNPFEIQRYVGRISGPLMDRIDIHVDVPAVEFKELRNRGTPEGDKSSEIRETGYWRRAGYSSNALPARVSTQTPRWSRGICKSFVLLDKDCENLLERAMNKQGLSARAHDRILKVARTIADLSAVQDISPQHVSEAINYRSLDKNYWK